jgi:Ca-activated chloride channel family protein
VTLTLTVKDGWGRYVTNLTQNNFTVFENGVQQDISFFSDMDSPATIGVIFDVSGSMGGGKIARSMHALRRFMLTSHPADEYSLIAFNNKVQLLADRTRDPNAVLDKVTGVRTKGNTALYDAVYLGTENVTRGPHQKRALLIIGDGQDNNSRYNVDEVRRLLKESDVIIYSVGINGNVAYSPEEAQGQRYLLALSIATGGQAFFPSSDLELDEIFERIALDLRHQYSIGYIPKDFNQDGKWRKLRARVSPPRGMPRLMVQTREGYYATPVAPAK